MKLLFSFLFISFINNNLIYAQPGSNSKWLFLFDGKTLNGWKEAQRDTLPDKSWYVENGILTFDPAIGHGSDIITTRSFKDFELSFEFKIAEGGNSGIKYFLLPNTSLGCEFQIIDDNRHPDAKSGINGNHKTGGLYDIKPPDSSKRYKPAGKWNTGRIVVKGNHAEHWLNNEKVLEYERDSNAFKEAIAKSKFKNTQEFAQAVSSPVLLQAHGDKVSFRKIKIKEL